MASLYKRATPSQARLLRIIEGAIKNAQDAHPGKIVMSQAHRRSIAKRAAGTLSAQWLDVLALATASEGGDATSSGGDAGHALFGEARSRLPQCNKATGRGVSRAGHSPLRQLVKAIAKEIRPLKAAGQVERAGAFIDVLKMIHQIETAAGGEAERDANA